MISKIRHHRLPVGASLLWSLVILAAMVPLTLSVYRKRTRP